MSRHQKKKSNPWDPKLMADDYPESYKTAAEFFFLKKNVIPSWNHIQARNSIVEKGWW